MGENWVKKAKLCKSFSLLKYKQLQTEQLLLAFCSHYIIYKSLVDLE